MKLIPSVLITSLSGKAGSIVAASWKGIQYARALVIPANPNTVAQQTQRGFLTKCVSWWHDIEEQLQDYCKLLILGCPLSGFNAFVKRNLHDLGDSVDPRILPLNAAVNPVADDLAVAAGTATKEIDITWSQGEAYGPDKMYFLSAEKTGTAFADNLVLEEKEATSTDTETRTLTMGKAAQDYWIFALVESLAESTFSIARVAFGTSQT